MKPIIPKAKILILVFSLLIIATPFVLAESSNCYIFETGVPFFAKKGECKSLTGLQNVPNVLIKALFPIAGVLAFIMIIWAGFEYAASGGNTNKQKTAQARIINALIGLFLLFAFWIILYTVNPDILNPQNLSFDAIITPPVYPYVPDFSYSNLTNVAKSFATNKKIDYIPDFDELEKVSAQYPQLAHYLLALKYYFGDPANDPMHGASCDTYVALVMRIALDPNYPKVSVPAQYEYLTQNNSFRCFAFSPSSASLSNLRSGDILFANTDTSDPGPDHTALKLDDGYYQASMGEYFPYGPTDSWYSSGWACRYIPAQPGGAPGGEQAF